MAAEEVLLKVEVDERGAFADLEKLKLSILRLKQEQQDLTKAFKAGNITQEEYAREIVRVEQILKTNQTAYNNLSKSVTGHKSKTDELIKSNKDLTASLDEAVKNINVMGVNLGGVMEQLASPKTGAIALVGALATAYLSSAAGARDLESAQESLRANFTFLSNELAKLVGADGKGGGLLTTLANAINFQFFGPSGLVRGLISSGAKNALRELELLQLDASRVAKNALDQAEELRRLRDDEEKTFEQRLSAARQVEGFINVREQVLVRVQQERLANLQALLAIDKDNLELQKEIKQIQFEISDIQEDSEGKRTEAINGINALLREQNKLLNDNAEINLQNSIKAQEELIKTQQIQDKALLADIQRIETNRIANENFVKSLFDNFDAKNEIVDEEIRLANKQTEELLKNSDARKQGYQTEIESFAMLTNEALRLQGVFGQSSRAAALTQLGIDTALAVSALVRYSEQNPANAPTGGAAGIATFAAGIIRIGANMAQAYKLVGGSLPGLGAGGSQTADSVKSALGYSDAQLQQLGLTVTDDGRIISTQQANREKALTAASLLSPVGILVQAGRLFRRLFNEGGYTGPGSVMQPAGIVHAGEVVWSQRDVAAVGGPAVADAMRPTFKGYNDGGLVTNTITSQNQMMGMGNLQVYVSWKEMRDFNNKMMAKAKFVEA